MYAHIELIEILSARLFIILSMARYSQTFIFTFIFVPKANIYWQQNTTVLDSFSSSII